MGPYIYPHWNEGQKITARYEHKIRKYGRTPVAETNPCQPYCCCDVEKYKWCIMVGMWLGFGIVFNLALHLLPKLF